MAVDVFFSEKNNVFLACFGIERETAKVQSPSHVERCMYIQAQAMAAGVAPRRMKWANGPQNRKDTGFNGTHVERALSLAPGRPETLANSAKLTSRQITSQNDEISI